MSKPLWSCADVRCIKEHNDILEALQCLVAQCEPEDSGEHASEWNSAIKHAQAVIARADKVAP